MNRQQVAEIVSIIALAYPYQFKDADKIIDAWLETLQRYDLDDVKARLHSLMGEDRFQKTPPTLDYLVRELQPICEKINWNERVVYCDICGRAFNKHDELDKHRERCSSVRYIIKQTKKWFNKALNKRELYKMSQDEFDKKYDQLLRVIYEHTSNPIEKKVIGCIFNPPNVKEAKELIDRIGIY